MAGDFNKPALPDAIATDIPAIKDTLNALAQIRPDLAASFPTGTFRLYLNATLQKWVYERYNGSAWENCTHFYISAEFVQGHGPSTTAVAGKIPVYDSQNRLVGNITGNAPTASKLANKLKLDLGGVVAASEVQFDGSETAKQTINVTTLYLNNVTDDAVTGTLTKAHGGTGNTNGTAEDVYFSHAGQTNLSAKGYGQIGAAKVINTKTNADSITMPGNYILQQQYVVNPDNNTTVLNWPEDCNYISFMKVYAQSVYIVQDWILNTRTWRRKSNNTGASWGAWSLLGNSYAVGTSIYISESGSDTNSGLDSKTPVKTFDRAVRIADNIWQGGTTSEIYFCFSRITETYSYGNIYLGLKPYRAILCPYDKSAYLGSVNVAPIFSSLHFYDGNVILYNVQVDGAINVMEDAHLTLAAGRQTVHKFYVFLGGSVVKNSDNNVQNVIVFQPDSSNSISYPFTIYDGGEFNFRGYAYILLNGSNVSGNIFLFLARGGIFRFIRGQLASRTVSGSNGVYTGMKYQLNPGSMVTSNEAGLIVAGLDAIFPGTTPEVKIGAIVNGFTVGQAMDANVVHKTGEETILGTKHFGNKNPTQISLNPSSTGAAYIDFDYNSSSYTPGVNPTTKVLSQQNQNVNGVNYGYIRNVIWNQTGGTGYFSWDIALKRWNSTDNVDDYHYFRFVRPANNKSYLYIPTNPEDSADNTHAATCHWVRQRIAEAALKQIATYNTSTANPSYEDSPTADYVWTVTGLQIGKPAFVFTYVIPVGSTTTTAGLFNQGFKITGIRMSENPQVSAGGSASASTGRMKNYYSIGGSFISYLNTSTFHWQPGSNVFAFIPNQSTIQLRINSPYTVGSADYYLYQ